ncbi:hypothetical protein CBL_00195 [Carabus blaptoides fortunei]
MLGTYIIVERLESHIILTGKIRSSCLTGPSGCCAFLITGKSRKVTHLKIGVAKVSTSSMTDSQLHIRMYIIYPLYACMLGWSYTCTYNVVGGVNDAGFKSPGTNPVREWCTAILTDRSLACSDGKAHARIRMAYLSGIGGVGSSGTAIPTVGLKIFIVRRGVRTQSTAAAASAPCR